MHWTCQRQENYVVLRSENEFHMQSFVEVQAQNAGGILAGKQANKTT